MSDVMTTLTAYARLGWRVLPIHSVRDGVCSCRKRESCEHPGKHPIFTGGCHSAATDEATIQAWFDLNPSVNWGIASEQASGLLVLDIDPRHGGDESLAELIRVHGDLPSTPTVKTGGGGRQFYFRYPSGSALTIGSGIRPGIDFRGEGGLVVAPPSVHKSGQRYEWLIPPETPVADPPVWLVELLTKRPSPPKSAEGSGMILTVRGETLDLTGDGVSEGGRHTALCQRVGVHLNRGDSRPTVEALAKTWAERCDPPMNESEIEKVLGDLWEKHHNRDEDDEEGDDEPKIHAPVLHPDAYYGLLGEMLKAIEPETEAHPAAVLLGWLTCFGNIVGRGAWVEVGAAQHYPALYVGNVGESSSGGKGSAWQVVLYPFAKIEPDWTKSCVCPGVGSGEGLIERVADGQSLFIPNNRTGQVEQQFLPGAADKRCLLRFSELSRLFKSQRRENNPLSEFVREMWDGGSISVPNRKANSLSTSGYTTSLVGDITPGTLQKTLATGTEAFDGFANRFLWAYVRGCPLLDGGSVCGLDSFLPRLANALAFGKQAGGYLHPHKTDAKPLWKRVHDDLFYCGDSVPHTDRARPQVVRLSLIFALLDGSPAIRFPHLKAALGVWEYCRESARMLFDGASLPIPGKTSPDVLAVRLLTVITSSPGINRRDLYRAVGGKVGKVEMSAALAHLRANHLAHPKNTGTEGRPAECWLPGADRDERTAMVLTVAGGDREMKPAPTTKSARTVPPERSHIGFEEIPILPDGSLNRMTLPHLSEEVRRRNGRFAWVGGKVGVVGVDPVPVEIACAVAEHQSDLRLFLPAEPQVCL